MKTCRTKFKMLYSASTSDQIVFRREFELLPQEDSHVNIVLTVTDVAKDPAWKGESGRIDADKIIKYVPDIPNALFYTCGSATDGR